MCSAAVNLDLTYTETIALIVAYRKHPTLWNPHAVQYHNRASKDEAWKLVAVETAVPAETCKRKIKSLLSSCRREKAKILQSRQLGDPRDAIQPTWRYWNAFRFLRGVGDGEEDPLGTAPEMDILEPSMRAKLGPPPATEIVMAEEAAECEEAAFGPTVAAKLRKMYPDQRLIAENLIHQALYKGTLAQLTAKSKIRTPDFKTLTQSIPSTPPVLEDPLKIDSSPVIDDESESSNGDSDSNCEFPHLTML